MKQPEKQRISVKKIERLVLPNIFRRICRQCQTEQTFVSTEQATYLTNLTSRQIFRLVELETVHFFETEEGFLFVCGESLKKFIRVRINSEKLKEKQEKVKHEEYTNSSF